MIGLTSCRSYHLLMPVIEKALGSAAANSKLRQDFLIEHHARSYIHSTPASMHNSSTCASCARLHVNKQSTTRTNEMT